MIAIYPDLCYTSNCLDEQKRGVLLLNAVTKHNISIVGKAPLVSGLTTSRCSSRQRRQANKGSFVMAKMSWVWIAGFFEGEGNVFWQEGKKGTKQSLHGRATIGQKAKAPLQEIHDFLIEQGFCEPSFYLRRANTSLRSTECWILTINRRDDVIRFYSEISSYLIEKKAQAEFVLNRLTQNRDERDSILLRAAELKKSGMSWREVSRQLGIGRRSLINYATSKGIDLERTGKREDGKSWKQDRVDRGLCERCGQPRGEDGTMRTCQSCAVKIRAWRNEYRRIHGRNDRKKIKG